MSDNAGSNEPANFLLYMHGKKKKSENKIPALGKAWNTNIITTISFLYTILPIYLSGALLLSLPPKIY